MQPLRYIRADTPEHAVELASAHPGARFLAGGTNLVDLLKFEIDSTNLVIDVGRLPLAAIEPLDSGGLRLGATADNTSVANHPLVRSRYGVLAEALLSGASTQIRNRATIAGNLLQRTRCPYFYDTASACNRRCPGRGCAAQGGVARSLALLGGSPDCIAVHPSDMCVAFAALDPVIVTLAPNGSRRIPFRDLLPLPASMPQRESALAPCELIVSVELSPPPGTHGRYLKVRDRQSYEFALVSAAVVLDIGGGTIRDARVAFGGVATVPWREPACEALLRGRPPSDATFKAAADAALAQARAGRSNGFKVQLARDTLLQALREVAI